MNITGVVRIDLSGYVEQQYLAIRDRDIRDVLAGVSEADCSTYLIDIGCAAEVAWDHRLVEALAECAASVTVVGDYGHAVAEASAQLRDALAIPAPRSAS